MLEKNLELLSDLIVIHCKISPKKKSRHRDVIDARKLFCLIAFENIKEFRYYKIAKFLEVHHATIIHHVRTSKDLLKYNQPFKEMYNTITNKFLINKKVSTKNIKLELELLEKKKDNLKMRFFYMTLNEVKEEMKITL
tara:strand:+ start:34 stop:447 length:414 start_codon:yes stop_codon:yes gene_type:complete